MGLRVLGFGIESSGVLGHRGFGFHSCWVQGGILPKVFGARAFEPHVHRKNSKFSSQAGFRI